MSNTIQPVSRENESPQAKKETLFKLISIEPDTLDRLTKATGWGRETTQMALLQLVADGRVKCRNENGHRFYAART